MSEVPNPCKTQSFAHDQFGPRVTHANAGHELATPLPA
jgi:hypothetical protein